MMLSSLFVHLDITEPLLCASFLAYATEILMWPRVLPGRDNVTDNGNIKHQREKVSLLWGWLDLE